MNNSTKNSDSIKKNKVFIRIFCIIVPILVNLVVMLVLLSFPFPIPQNQAYDVWISFMDFHPELNLTYIPSFLIPIFVSICVQNHKRRKNNLSKDEFEKYAILNAPIRCALVSVVGWALELIFQIFCLAYVTLKTGVNVFVCLGNSVVSTVLAWILVFSSTYLLMETLNRAKFIPIYFSKGKISGTKKEIKLSITFTFLMYYIGVGMFPVIALLLSDIIEKTNNGLAIKWSVVIVILLFLCVGIYLTVLLSNLFKKPLKDLNLAAEKISKGDYSNRVKVVSADEIGTLGETFNEMTASLAEKEFMKDVFGKIVTPDVRDHLLGEGMEGIALGGENMDVTILFCDIRGFTTMSEKLPPEKVVQILNQYFTAMSECITNHHGIINKYIGDAIMAIFGAPIKSTTHAMDAYLASLEMKQALEKVNEDFSKKGFPEIRFGIGIHTGTVLAGNIGSSARMEYTVIGDSVNVASRIEGLCKEHKCDLLISESTLNKMKENPLADKMAMPEFLCESTIRGKEEKIKLYTIVDNR